MIEDLLINKTSGEKANIKAREIVKIDFRGEYTSPEYGVRIDIISVKIIQEGIEVMAKAWMGVKQVGFGRNGTAEIERFLIYNPPVLVDDPNGTIIREWTDERTGELKQRKLREDPVQAIREVITHNVTLVGQEGTNIVKGSIANTNSTFFSRANGDGKVQRINQINWTTARDTATGDSDTATAIIQTGAEHEVSGSFYAVERGFYPFDTSNLPDDDTINSAIFSVYATTADDASGRGLIFGLILTSQVSVTALESGDFDAMTINSPAEGATRVVIDTTGVDTSFTLNSTGLAWVDTTGDTKLGIRHADDIDDASPPLGRQFIQASSSDETGTSQDPTLVVTHPTTDRQLISNVEKCFV